ncbi:hypothetical protein KC19_2G145800 [Ceratodon purpureus]|uniref:Uncharacterized protein n=1 Tax=Ceratodon purpureus TaxID=3225 RepID=A0A8T0IW63_CERPU|nr:hypothetical protein KC19_2G145800 [Ceratodon purpureus]
MFAFVGRRLAIQAPRRSGRCSSSPLCCHVHYRCLCLKLVIFRMDDSCKFSTLSKMCYCFCSEWCMLGSLLCDFDRKGCPRERVLNEMRIRATRRQMDCCRRQFCL